MPTSPAKTPNDLPSLSRRLAEVAALVADGLSDKQIAKRTGVNPRTVRVYIVRIARRLALDRSRNLRTQITRKVAAA